MAEDKKKKELPIVDIDIPDIDYGKKDHLLRGLHAKEAEYKKKYGDKWKNVVQGIVHVHTTHRKDHTTK